MVKFAKLPVVKFADESAAYFQFGSVAPILMPDACAMSTLAVASATIKHCRSFALVTMTVLQT
jgi:hypothetical protein